MLFNKYYFRFSILGTILAIIGISVFFNLGTWQVNRAQLKEKMQHEIESKRIQPSFTLKASINDINDKIHTKVNAYGHFDNKNEILIDNEIHQGKAGYHVLTPLILEDKQSVIMVNRGWVPLGRSRDILPELTAPSGNIIINGRISRHKSKPALILDQEDSIPGKVWPYFDSEKYIKHTGYNLLPVVILMDAKADGGYARKWPNFNANKGMHIGYAIQWYVFAAIVLITYLGVNLKKKEQQDSNDTNND